MKNGSVVYWKGGGKQRHYGVVVGIEGRQVRVEYTHSVPVTNQEAGRVVTLNRMRLVLVNP